MTRYLPAALLFAVVLLSRGPFTAQTLWAHDSALYANALERGFHVDDDPFQQRPHPPGYLFYVLAANALRAAGLGSNDALIAVSAIASALAAAGIFLLARRWTSQAVAAIAALAFAANPFVWHYSEVAYPYTVLSLGSIVVASACLLARGRTLRAGLAASVVLGLASGFRQDVLVLLLPLWLWSMAPLGPRRMALAGAACALTCLTWIVPTSALSGGIGDYVEALRNQAGYVRQSYSVAAQGLPALVVNLAMTSWSVGWALLAMAPLALAATLMVARRAWATRRLDDSAFLLLWTVPPLATYVVLHIGEWGYVLSAIPGLYVLGAQAVQFVIDAMAPRHRRPALVTACVALVIVPATLFVITPIPFSNAMIDKHDGELLARVRYVRDHYTPHSTLILTREDHLLVRYYLPEYRARQYDPEPFVRSYRRMRTTRIERVVVFTAGLVAERSVDVRRVKCGPGVELVYLDVIPGSVLEFHGERFAIASPAP